LTLAYWGRDLDLSGSCEGINQVIIRFNMGPFLLEALSNQASSSNGFQDNTGKCDAMIDMISKTSKQRSRSFILVPIDFSYATSYIAVNSNFCSKTHSLAAIHRPMLQTTDRWTKHCSVSYARLLVACGRLKWFSPDSPKRQP